jgi:cysteine-rich repeat protein
MRSILLPAIALSFMVACAGSDEDEGAGGEGGAGTTTVGSTTTTTTTGSPTTTTSGMMTTSSSTSSSTASSGGGGEGGVGGMNEGGGPPAGYIVETEPNDTFGQSNDLPDGEIGFAAELPMGDIDVFAVEAPLGATMSVVVSDGYGGCPADANMLVQVYDPTDLAIAQGNSLCPTLNGQNDTDLNSLAQAGTYFIYVSAPAAVEEYAIDITVTPPVCGDNVTQLGEECDDGNMTPADGCENDCTITPVCGDSSLQTGEECDDGNTMSGDGCDSACQFEGNLCPETEVNNTLGQANSGPGCAAWVGQIGVVGDVDFYAVEVTTAGSRIGAEVVDLNGTGCPSAYDSTLYLFDAAMNQLAYDDDDAAFGNCSLIHHAGDPGASNLPVGTYYLAVHEYSDDSTSPPYRLNVNVVVPGCGDGILQAGEVCDDGNTVDGDGCSSACQILSCSAGQVAVVLDATDLPQNIDDNDVATPALSTVTVADVGTVAQVALKLNIDHDYMGDVEVSLDPPGASELFLTDNIGSSNDDMINTFFTSSAAQAVTGASPPWSGVWTPQGNLAGVVGTTATGAWTVKALDNAGGIAGVFQTYTLYLCVQP